MTHTYLRACRSAAIAIVVALAAALPASGQPAPLFTHGVACGEPTSTDVLLWTRTATAATLTPELLDATDNVIGQLAPVPTGPDSDFTVKISASALAPGSTVRYRFRGPAGELSPIGTCKTAPPADQAVPFTFGFSGDADWKWRPYSIVNALARESLEFFVFLGDTIYETTNLQGSTVAEDLPGYRLKYRENRELPDGLGDTTRVPLRDLYASFAMFSVPDNHELGTSVEQPTAPRYTEGGAPAAAGSQTLVNQTPGFDDRMRAYQEYQPLRARPDPNGDTTRRLYFSQPWGTSARLIVVDDRSYRDIRLANSDDPHAEDPSRTILGTTQFEWLLNELLVAQASGVTWKFVVISSPIQHIGRASEIGVDLDGSKSWAGGYRVERDRLLKFIDDQAIDNVVFLSTDNHNTMINNLDYHQVPEDQASPRVPARNAFEIITGPLGAGFGYPGVKADLNGVSGREAERRVAQTLAGDIANSEGELRGQRQAAIDPIGLEPETVHVIPDSIVAEGGQSGTLEAAAFASFNTFTYAVLSVDGQLLTVRVTGMPGADIASLLLPGGLPAYADAPAHTILQFQVQAN